MKLFSVLATIMIVSIAAMMVAGLPLWLSLWLGSFEYGFIGFMLWWVVQPDDRMSVPRALFLWWPALWMNRRQWLRKG